jgi:hypothetical protein
VGPGPEGYNAFHGAIMTDELCRCASGGLVWGIVGGLGIGLPPVLHFGSQALQDKVAPGCLAGEKFICLCITEPMAGSDVASLRCTAVKDPTGKFYVVNGQKKWITNGVFADFFTVAVRTGGEGASGLSLLLVERGPGVTTKQMDCMGVWSSGTTYITFEDVKVPVENLIGTEGDGFKYIMHKCVRRPRAAAASAPLLTLADAPHAPRAQLQPGAHGHCVPGAALRARMPGGVVSVCAQPQDVWQAADRPPGDPRQDGGDGAARGGDAGDERQPDVPDAAPAARAGHAAARRRHSAPESSGHQDVRAVRARGGADLRRQQLRARRARREGASTALLPRVAATAPASSRPR